MVFLVLQSCAPTLNHLNAFDGFNGKPSRVEIIPFSIKYTQKDTLTETGIINVLYYDSKGRRIRQIAREADGSTTMGGWVYEYDAQEMRLRLSYLIWTAPLML